MARTRRDDHQLRLPPAEVPNPESSGRAFHKSESAGADGYATAAALLNAALDDPDYGMTSQELAYLLKVSESLVHKWRSPDVHASPSFAQLARLPITFHLALHRAMNRHFGFGRAALRRILDELGALAVVHE